MMKVIEKPAAIPMIEARRTPATVNARIPSHL
jgi:hypothetical protein